MADEENTMTHTTLEDSGRKRLSGRRVRRGASLAVVGAAAGSALALAFVPSAQAIPIPQASYHYYGAYVQTQAQGATALPGAVVSVNNGKVARKVIVQVSLDAGIVSKSELRLSYLVDGVMTPEYKYGPANLANYTQFWQTRTADAIIPLGPGAHRIQVVLRVSSSNPAAQTFVQDALITAEARTS
jgi:hypothetical protein